MRDVLLSLASPARVHALCASSPSDTNGDLTQRIVQSFHQAQNPRLDQVSTLTELAAMDAPLAQLGNPHDSANGQCSPTLQAYIPVPFSNQPNSDATNGIPLESGQYILDPLEDLDMTDWPKLDDKDIDEFLKGELESFEQIENPNFAGSGVYTGNMDVSNPNPQSKVVNGMHETQWTAEGEIPQLPAATAEPMQAFQPPYFELPTRGNAPVFPLNAPYRNYGQVLPPRQYQHEQRERFCQAQQVMMPLPPQSQYVSRYVPFNQPAAVSMQHPIMRQYIQPGTTFAPRPQPPYFQPRLVNQPREARGRNSSLYDPSVEPRPMNVLTEAFELPRDFKPQCDETGSAEGAPSPQDNNIQSEAEQPTVRVRRSKAAAKTNPLYRRNAKYAQLTQPPSPWQCFKYTLDGELRQVFTPKELTRFLFQHPLRTHPSKTLALRIHRNPPHSRARYPLPQSHSCRFNGCPAPNGTINQGQYVVAFDEQNEGTDPFLVAGYVHLFCIERFIDFPRVCKELDVAPDTRVLPQEHKGKNLMRLGLKGEEKIIEDFVMTCQKGVVPSSYPSFNREDRPYEGTLCHTLSTYKLRKEPASIGKQRELRFEEAGYVGSTLSSHLGNLEVEMGIREKTRRHAYQAQIVERPVKNRVFHPDRSNGDGGDTEVDRRRGQGEMDMECATEDDYLVDGGPMNGRSSTYEVPAAYQTPVAIMAPRRLRGLASHEVPVANMGSTHLRGSSSNRVPVAKMGQTDTHGLTRGKKRDQEDTDASATYEPLAKRTRSGARQ